MKCKDCNKREINLSRSNRCCDVCLDKRNYRQKDYYKNNTEKEKKRSAILGKIRTSKLRLLGLCLSCGKFPTEYPSHTLCKQCKSKNKTYKKGYYNKNKKKIQESQKRSMAKKPEAYKALKHKTYENNKDSWYRWGRERRDRKLKAEGSYTSDEWNKLLLSYDNKCLRCGSSERIEADHIIPLSKGGTDYITNIQPLCRTCNASKGTRIWDFRPFNVFGS